MSSILVLTQKAEVKQAKLSSDNVTFDVIQKFFKKKTAPELLCTYPYKNLTLFLFGYTKGKAGTENKHELPPPHDETLAFGDIVIVVSKDERSFANPILFKVSDYELFYSKVFGGFEELEDYDDDDDFEEDIDIEDDIDEVDIDEVDEVDDAKSYVSDVKEEIPEIKKEKALKKKAIIVNTIVSIHPDNQLNVNSPKNTIREKVIESMKSIFIDFKYQSICDLEHEIYKRSLLEADTNHIVKDWTIKLFTNIYLANIRKIVGNLDSSSYVQNKELIKRYNNKELTLEELCSMDYYGLFASKWKESIERQQMIEKLQLEGNKSMATDQFLCRKCFKRECTYYEMQTRSADEPMTIFINCLSCGNNWRQ